MLSRILLTVFFWMGLLPVIQAHQVSSVEFVFQATESQWRLSGDMDIAFMLPETRRVPGGLPLSRKAVMKASPGELARIRKETDLTLRKLLKFTFQGKEIRWHTEFPDFEKIPFELPVEPGDAALLSTRIIIDAVPGAGELKIHWSGEEESELIISIEDGEDAKIISASPGGELVLLKVESTGKAIEVKQPVVSSWISTGFRHVLPKGWDHMLFMLGLFLLLPKWKPLAGQSLLFTFSHSLTLSLAVLGYITLPSKLVEALIAASIAWVGIENLFTRTLGKKRLILIFCFGLLHGMGFASVLAEKLDGIPRSQQILPLIGFNLGVEVAQLTVLTIAFLLLWPVRKWTPQVQKLGSVAVAVAGIYLMIERSFF